MLNTEYLGHKSEPRTITVERGQVLLFAKAIGETNPIYLDEEAAKAAGHPNILAPPTFGACLKFLAPAETPTYEHLGLDYKGLLHAEEKIDYFLPIHVGQELTLLTEITDMYDKKGGALEFLLRETNVYNDAQALVQKVTTTTVMRRSV